MRSLHGKDALSVVNIDMLCWCNIIVSVIPVIMFIRDGYWVLFAIALLNLLIHLWSYNSFRKLTESCGCPGMCPAGKGHPTLLEKSEINFAAVVNIGTFAIAIGLIIYGVILNSPIR